MRKIGLELFKSIFLRSRNSNNICKNREETSIDQIERKPATYLQVSQSVVGQDLRPGEHHEFDPDRTSSQEQAGDQGQESGPGDGLAIGEPGFLVQRRRSRSVGAGWRQGRRAGWGRQSWDGGPLAPLLEDEKDCSEPSLSQLQIYFQQLGSLK